MNKIKTEYINIDQLKPSEYNPRKASEKEWKDLEVSIKEFGLVDPVIVNKHSGRENIIIGGHFRVKVAKSLGITEVPVVYLDLSLEKEKELNLRLNKNLGEWDWNLLANFDIEFLSQVGFGKENLGRIFDRDIGEDEAPPLPEEPISKYGNLYQLGKHRLICGDATKIEDVEKLMAGKKAHMIFTDPPYNVNYKSDAGYSCESTKFGGAGNKIFNDNKTDLEAINFYTQSLLNLYSISKDDAVIYWWFANKNNWINRIAFEEAGWHMSQIIIWLKNSMDFSKGQDYHRVYESCMVGWKKGKMHFKNKTLNNLQDVQHLDLDEFEEILNVWYVHRDVTTQYVHPTQKPVRLAERALKKSSGPGDIVVDFFAGSGSTMIACEQMNRNCYMLELDPKYCDVIIKRYENFTGNKAKVL